MTMDSVPSTIKDIPIDDDNGSVRPKMLAVDDLRSSDQWNVLSGSAAQDKQNG